VAITKYILILLGLAVIAQKVNAQTECNYYLQRAEYYFDRTRDETMLFRDQRALGDKPGACIHLAKSNANFTRAIVSYQEFIKCHRLTGGLSREVINEFNQNRRELSNNQKFAKAYCR
jgi:hypothetical protein